MNDSELRDIYMRALTNRADHPAPEALIALVTQTGSEASRLATLDHVMSCVSCKQDFELLRAIHAADQANAGAARLTPRRLPVPWLAAAAVLIATGALTLTLVKPSELESGARRIERRTWRSLATRTVPLVWRAVPDVQCGMRSRSSTRPARRYSTRA